MARLKIGVTIESFRLAVRPGIENAAELGTNDGARRLALSHPLGGRRPC